MKEKCWCRSRSFFSESSVPCHLSTHFEQKSSHSNKITRQLFCFKFLTLNKTNAFILSCPRRFNSGAYCVSPGIRNPLPFYTLMKQSNGWLNLLVTTKFKFLPDCILNFLSSIPMNAHNLNYKSLKILT